MEMDDSSEKEEVINGGGGGGDGGAGGGDQELVVELAQNKSITVTIDDLAEGLLVVSFAHSDNLYQGVLFQLNRERGIPSGISFAKEHPSLQEKYESDPSQMNPLHQRHSYNQGNGGGGQGGGGLCNGSAHYHGPPAISQPSLRRIIKPPARFRNARMSLRLRARPVLCAKCRSLCDDKADNGGSGSNKGEETSGGGGGGGTESNQKGKKDNQPKTKLSNKNNSGDNESESSSISSKVTSSPSKHGSSRMNGKLQGDEPRQTNCVTEPADLRYESVGSTGVVENYWRRPLVKPLIASTEETYARLRKQKGSSSSSSTTGSSSGGSGRRVKNSSNAVAPPPPPEKLERVKSEESPGEYLTKSAIVCDTNNFPNTRSRKALNLKMCISKIAERRKKDKGGGGGGISGKPLETLIKLKDHASLTNTLPVSQLLLQNQSDSSVESTEEMMDNNNGWSAEAVDECVGGSGSRSSPKKAGKLSSGGKKSKDWENRMRTKSTVPVRYRDESYLTKNDIFNFHNKRKKPLTRDSKIGRDSGGDIPVLTISRRDDDENTFKVTALSTSATSSSEHMESSQANDQTVTTSKIIDDSEESGEENEEEDEQEENGAVAVHSTVQLASSSTHLSPEEDEDLQNRHLKNQSPSCSSSSTLQSDQPSIKTSSTAELIKTPTIKITFGSSGNGMVVQIPPKVAQNPMSSATSGCEDNPLMMSSTHHLKHMRKAMKKAKKEAKRRRSNSPSPSSSNAMSPPPTALEAHQLQHPPPAPILIKSLLIQSSGISCMEVSNEQEASSSQQDDLTLSQENNLCDQLSSGEPSTYSSSRTAKKRKKEKKRRRGSKALKENDSGSSHQSTSSNSTTSSSAFLNSTSLAEGDDVSSIHPPENIADSSSPPPPPPTVIQLQLDPPQIVSKRQTFPNQAPTQSSPPRRRRSMPATSSSSGEAPRVCINLKRIDSNAYVPLLPLSSSHSDNDDPSPLEESTSANGQALLDRDDGPELSEFPLNTGDVGGGDDGSSPHRGADFVGGESVDCYKDKETECLYRKGDIVWGKLPACPWWPGKIDDILTTSGEEETRAKVSWYKSTTQSCVRFKMLVPFQEYFDSKYARSRRRGLYQNAVKDALVEAHKLNPQQQALSNND